MRASSGRAHRRYQLLEEESLEEASPEETLLEDALLSGRTLSLGTSVRVLTPLVRGSN